MGEWEGNAYETQGQRLDHFHDTHFCSHEEPVMKYEVMLMNLCITMDQSVKIA